MDVRFKPRLAAKLSKLAAERGSSAETLVEEAVERFVDYDDWFLHEVDEGLAAADRGDLVEHSDIRRLIDVWYPG